MSLSHGKFMGLIEPEIEALVSKAYQLGSSDGYESGLHRAEKMAKDLGHSDLAEKFKQEAEMPF
jgi:hypothetical protein